MTSTSESLPPLLTLSPRRHGHRSHVAAGRSPTQGAPGTAAVEHLQGPWAHPRTTSGPLFLAKRNRVGKQPDHT